MRILLIAVACAGVSLASEAAAQDRTGFVQGFGGLRLGTVAATDTTFGAVVAKDITPNLQVLGELGRISDVLPTTIDPLLTLSPVGFNVSAWYGQAGLRFTASNRAAIRPYVETTAGIARLQTNVGPVGSSLADLLVNTSLRFFDRTDPLATVGGGVAIAGGPFMVDVGYRYRRIFGPEWMEALSFSRKLTSSEARIGVGVRF